jgi:Domain of unknown function (DUF4468) with TBP-like fold
MKKYILGLIMMFSVFSFSQETEFKFTKNGFTDFVVIPVENKTQSELYKKTIDWISVTFNNPKEVLKAQIENDYLRFESVEKNLFCLKPAMCSDMKYQIEVSFKDGKYKFDLLTLDQDMPDVGWVHFAGIEDGKFYFTDNGEPKAKFKIISEDIPKYFNSLNKSLNDFIVDGGFVKKKNDW